MEIVEGWYLCKVSRIIHLIPKQEKGGGELILRIAVI